MSALLKSADEVQDILGLLVLINPRCPHYDASFGGKNSGLTGLDVSASLAGLPQHVQRYAFLLGEGLKTESVYEFNYQTHESARTKTKNEVITENSKLVGTVIKSGDFYRVKNVLRRLVENELIASKITPKTATIPQIANGLAGCALFQKVKAKGHCGTCSGEGWNIFDHIPKKCDACDGSGQSHYTIDERAKLAGMKITKKGYSKTWERFENWASSELCNWENDIRDKLLALVRIA